MGNLKSIVAIVIAVMVCMGCTRKVYVPIEKTSVRVDTVMTTKVKNDSVYLHDSVYVDRSADTIKVYRWRTLAKTIQKVDTVYKVQLETVEKDKPVVVGKETSGWVEFFALLGVVFVLVVVLVIWEEIKIWREIKKEGR